MTIITFGGDETVSESCQWWINKHGSRVFVQLSCQELLFLLVFSDKRLHGSIPVESIENGWV